MDKVLHQLKVGSDKSLLLFPYLGGGVHSFTKLVNALRNNLNIWVTDIPGHGKSSASLVSDMDTLIDLYVEALIATQQAHQVFLGHSMGAIVAYCLIQKLVYLGHSHLIPKTLILSACNTPHYFKVKKNSALSDGELIQKIYSYGGIPEEILKEGSLLKYYLPTYRSGFKILEHAAEIQFTPLEINVYYLWGENDSIVSFDEVLKWSSYFKQEIKLIPKKQGSHMFITDDIGSVARLIETVIDKND